MHSMTNMKGEVEEGNRVQPMDVIWSIKIP